MPEPFHRATVLLRPVLVCPECHRRFKGKHRERGYRAHWRLIHDAAHRGPGPHMAVTPMEAQLAYAEAARYGDPRA